MQNMLRLNFFKVQGLLIFSKNENLIKNNYEITHTRSCIFFLIKLGKVQLGELSYTSSIKMPLIKKLLEKASQMSLYRCVSGRTLQVFASGLILFSLISHSEVKLYLFQDMV